MMCSEKELGLAAESAGILELPADAPVGEDIRDYLNLNDQLFTLKLTPNRSDCLSIVGIAREVAEETGLQADQVSLVGVYGFERKNQLIIAYHVRASGEVCLSPELAEYKLVGHADISPWPAGTGPALFDWLVSKGYQPVYKEWGVG